MVRAAMKTRKWDLLIQTSFKLVFSSYEIDPAAKVSISCFDDAKKRIKSILIFCLQIDFYVDWKQIQSNDI